MKSWVVRQIANLAEACPVATFLGSGLIFGVLLACLWQSVALSSEDLGLSILVAIVALTATAAARNTLKPVFESSDLAILAPTACGCLAMVCGFLVHTTAHEASSALITLGGAALLLLWSSPFSILPLRGRVVGTAAAGLVACGLWLAISFVPPSLQVVLATASTIGSSLLFIATIRGQRAPKDQGERLAPPAGLLQHAKSIPLPPSLLGTALCFGAITYLLLHVVSLTHFAGAVQPENLCAVLCIFATAVISLIMAKIMKRESAYVAYFPTSFLVIVGALLIGFSNSEPILLIVGCCISFTGCYIYLPYYWIILGNHAYQHAPLALSIYAIGIVSFAIGSGAALILCSILPPQDLWWKDGALCLMVLAFFIPFQIANGAALAGETKAMGGTPFHAASTSEEERVMKATEQFALSTRESEVLLLLYQGRSVPYICNELFIAESTVRTHLKHIYAKASVSNRQELIDAVRSFQD